ncbi:unnamed protein product [Heligmosomoides polygyrus]|uniref:Zinc_ribbon_16 domain-containing protein n=1 Tax=Heligmosomoides polygyrus TaxID=6339 RepID=A0A183F833_HELPZ|nr:unnamed protein product [Heligmosomoides polygyrus]
MCSHGGHTKHVISWFEKEEECPVLGCDCSYSHETWMRSKNSLMNPPQLGSSSPIVSRSAG